MNTNFKSTALWASWIRWQWQEYRRNQRCNCFLHRMTELYGPADCSGGQRSWRVNGVLCTVWLLPMRLTIYYATGCEQFELGDSTQCLAAEWAIAHLPFRPENAQGYEPRLERGHYSPTNIMTPETNQHEAASGCPTQPCSPVFLKLEEFTSGGSKYIRCADDNQRPLLSHLLNGAGACLFAEELPKVQMIANAHGWVVHLIPENEKSPDAGATE